MAGMLVGVPVATGCAVEPQVEAVGSSADALTMACGTYGRTSYNRSGGGAWFDTGYVEAESEALCIAAPCIEPTAAQLMASATKATNYMLADCVDDMSRHTCPPGCKLTVNPTCTVMSMRKSGPLPPFNNTPLCTVNDQLNWQKTCKYAISASVVGTADVYCGKQGSDLEYVPPAPSSSSTAPPPSSSTPPAASSAPPAPSGSAPPAGSAAPAPTTP